MKKGIEVLGAEFVLDEFHMQNHIRKMARPTGGSTENKKNIFPCEQLAGTFQQV